MKPTHERRKYLRIESPLAVRIIGKNNVVEETKTKDISPLGLRLGTKGDSFDIKDEFEIKVEMPAALSPIHAKARVMWKRKISTENGSPFDIGCEFTKIEEDNKNTFLKYFCDLLYEQK